jgi:long-chain fatty acid transport protein
MGAAGFANEAIAARPLGRFNCVTAQAGDPSAVFFNPAGLTQLDGWQMSINDNMLDIRTRHTSAQGQTTDTQGDLLHAPGFFITKTDSEHRFALGLGAYAPFGLETQWADDSFARYSATLSRLDIAMITPSFAYRVSAGFQVGVGVNVALATDVDLRKKTPGSSDGDSRQEATGHGIGMNAGLRFQPGARQTLGLTYRSPISLPLDGTQRLTHLTGAAAFVFGGSSYETGVKARINLPQEVTLGYQIQPTSRWDVEADAQWTDWTSINTFHVTFDEPNLLRNATLNAGVDPLHRDWHAEWSLGAGSEYRPDDKWALRGGLGYLWAAVPESSFEPSLPDANRFEVTAGFSRRLFTNNSIHFAYNGVFMRPRTVSNNVDGGAINGKYETRIDVYSVGFEQKF